MDDKIIIVLGSSSDVDYIKPAVELLKKFDIDYDIKVSSAHRTPDRTVELAKSFEDNGYKVAIVAAGLSAHLPGVIASNTDIPVIGIPIPSGHLGGVDSLLSINQMPGGVPVATMSIGKNGAVNSVLFSLRVLALDNKEIKDKLKEYRLELSESVLKSEDDLKKSL